MSKYDIYAVGAALVDTEIVVDEAFLSNNNIDKGVMTLVDESRQAEILAAVEDANHHVKKSSGGSACNTVVAACEFGAKCFYSAKVAKDADGDFYRNDLTNAGVTFHRADFDEGITGKCLVMVTPDADRTMNTFLGASVELSAKEVDFDALKNSEWLYLEGYLLTDDPRTQLTVEVIQFARTHGVKTALSLSDPFVVQVFKDNILKVIGGGVDLIFCNEDEAKAFTGKDSIEEAATELKNVCSSFAITLGKQGALSSDGNTIYHTPCIPTDAVDTNGAGDMFAGAFLFGLTSNKGFEWSAKLANAAASRIVSQYGPRLETIEFDHLKQEFNI